MKKHLILTVIFTLLMCNVFTQTVYVTKTGTKYHKSTCHYLSQSSISISLSDAIAKGYTACSVCKPSSAITSEKQSVSQPSPKSTTPVKTGESTQKTTPTEKQSVAQPSSKVTTEVQCSATTKAGTRCKRMTKSPNGKCWQHGGD